VQGPVYSGDRIITGRAGEAQLQFRDGTKLVVGENSSIVLDAFVISADNTARQVSIDVVKGAMRFITGSGPKDAYAISTPTATISVRGTAFDLEVEPAGTTRVAVFSGATQTCDRLPPARRTCILQTANCDVSITSPGRVPRPLTSRDERLADLRLYFPYVTSQASLLAPFRVDTTTCGFGRADITPSPDVVNPTIDVITRTASVPNNPPNNPPNDPPHGPPPPPPPPGDDDGGGNHCGGNCGNGNGNGGGNGTGNEGNGKGPSDDHENHGKGNGKD
jgi:FecR protein